MVLQPQQKLTTSEICIAPKTAAIVLKQTSGGERRCFGERLFTLFKRANAGCSWNQQLYQAIRKIVLVGFLRPHTLLVYGTSDHVEALRSAWIKNILAPPDNYSLLYFGDLEALHIETVSSTNFTPLPDALCSVILQLNRRNISATLSVIKHHLQRLYARVQPPSDQVVFEALNTLTREKKICLADTGYFISSDAHTKPLSILITNPTLSPRLLLVSPHKAKKSSSDLSPTKAKPANKKVSHSADGGDGIKQKSKWPPETTDEQKKPATKDKSGPFRRLFGLKPKVKKRSESATSSGCSSAASPPLSNDEDGLVELHQQTLGDDSNALSLTAALVPFQLTRLPSQQTVNESMTVHCGNTVLQDTLCAVSDSENEDDYSIPTPTVRHRPMRKGRHRATSCLVKKQVYSYRQRLNSFASTESGVSGGRPTRRRHRSKRRSSSSYRSDRTVSDRNSTRLSVSDRRSNPLTTLPPDVSSINVCTAASASQLLLFSTLSSPADATERSRKPGDGETTPKIHRRSALTGAEPPKHKSASLEPSRGRLDGEELDRRRREEATLIQNGARFGHKDSAGIVENNDSTGSDDSSHSFFSSPPTTCKKVTVTRTHF